MRVIVENAIYLRKALSSCCVLEFPSGCSRYEEPLSEQCYETIWKEVGCSTEGLNNVVGEKLIQLNSSNIR